MTKLVDVAAAVILRPDGSFLLGQRAPGTFYPGYWEFPGGKVEPGETPRAALIRELDEELGLEVLAVWPWLMRTHRYEHAHVRLHFFRVPEWRGTPSDRVHAQLVWTTASAPGVEPMLPANGPVFAALRLPAFMAVTQAASIGMEAQLAALERLLARGPALIQVREAALAPAQRAEFAAAALAIARAAGSPLVINADIDLARAIGADGVHLTAAGLAATGTRPPFALVGASCHGREELLRAAELGLDYAVLGSVQSTVTHPDRAPLGWDEFARLAAELPLPVFAIGGMRQADLASAQEHGAHGIAAIRAAGSSAP
ncbi:MAG: Nudix family hydrolase [Rhodocyclaceae bacterium]|nr:Nudix family hydrolase [Rhodocyclaceae bacterium]MBX3667890.1 Nudix family hydrolase [Rhodocyclaceae bacterium]